MKKLALVNRLICIAAVAVALPAFKAVAVAPQTNAVQNINVELTFLTQGPTLANHPHSNDTQNTAIKTSVATKDVISWLSTATGTNFPPRSRLVRVRHFNASTNSVTIEVRYSTNSVDVTQFFNNSSSSEKVDT